MRIVNILLIGLSIVYTAFGCQEEEVRNLNQELPEDAEIIYLASGEEYKYPLGLAVEDHASIKVPPQFAAVSEFYSKIDRGGGYIYRSKPVFEGNDLVVLEVCRSIGGSDCYQVNVIKLGFVVGANRKWSPYMSDHLVAR